MGTITKTSKGIEVLRTPEGRYIWHPVLSIIDFIPKGKRSYADTIGLRFDESNPVEILYLALKHAGCKMNREVFRNG